MIYFKNSVLKTFFAHRKKNFNNLTTRKNHFNITVIKDGSVPDCPFVTNMNTEVLHKINNFISFACHSSVFEFT